MPRVDPIIGTFRQAQETNATWATVRADSSVNASESTTIQVLVNTGFIIRRAMLRFDTSAYLNPLAVSLFVHARTMAGDTALNIRHIDLPSGWPTDPNDFGGYVEVYNTFSDQAGDNNREIGTISSDANGYVRIAIDPTDSDKWESNAQYDIGFCLADDAAFPLSEPAAEQKFFVANDSAANWPYLQITMPDSSASSSASSSKSHHRYY